MDVIDTTKQMNSDMFHQGERMNYDIKNFSRLDVDQAKESFLYNGYKYFDSDGVLSVNKKGRIMSVDMRDYTSSVEQLQRN